MLLRSCRLILLLLVGFSLSAAKEASYSTLSGRPPLVIAHRGASGYLPEHTLEAYQLAMDMGADFIEPDLVITKDGELVARHEGNIIDSTDVLTHPEFSSRRTIKSVDGLNVDGFFVEDFTLAELKTLRAVQNYSHRDQSYNGLYSIPTLREIIELVQSYEKASGRGVGIYPETKHPSYFRNLGLALEKPLIELLVEKDFTDPKRVYIQSFEVTNLKETLSDLMKKHGLRLPLVQLFDEWHLQPFDYVLAGRKETYGDLIQKESLKNFVANYAAGIGLWKDYIIKRDAKTSDGLRCEVLPIVAMAHASGLVVHTYTMRSEKQFLTPGYTSVADEYNDLMALGVDGFFSDFPDTARRIILQQKDPRGFMP